MSPTFKRLLDLHRPYLGRLVLATAMMVVAAGIPPALVLLVEQVLDKVLIARDAAALAMLPLAVVGLYALNGVLAVTRAMITRTIAFQVVTELRRQLFAALLALPPSWHQSRPLGRRLTLLTEDVGQAQYLVSAYATVVQRPLTLIGLAAAAIYMDWRLALSAFVVLPLVVLPIRVFGRRLRRASRARLDKLGDLNAAAQETLSGLRVVQALGAEPQRIAAFDVQNQRQLELSIKATLAQLLPSPMVELVASIAVAVVIAVGGRLVFQDAMQPGELVAFLLALGLMNLPLKSLSEVVSLTHRALAGAEGAFAVIDEDSGLPDGDTELRARSCTLRFEGVAFDYGAGPVLEDIDLELAPGTLTVLVGHSGAGKSTLLNLVLRFSDPTAGCIRVNGHDLRDLTLRSLRRHIAVVTQDPVLFHASVRDNLLLARPDATQEQLEAACKAAWAHDFIQALPQGYDTPLQEEGMRLSGGERQRICIARALLADAPILLLDEATSALDPESEAMVQSALAALMKGRTVLAIAHRGGLIEQADQVVELSHGRIVDTGAGSSP